jgi:Gpi18-like mannosyltransferase/4-amino-4-deoxy-L-arabinose transferase-like glycosyltransferase
MISGETSHPLWALQRKVNEKRSVVALPRRSVAALHATIAFGLVFALLGSAQAADQIRNGGFVDGKDGRPSLWSTEQWSTTAGTAFEWRGGGEELGVAIVRNPSPNDSRWVQAVAVEPNKWYRLSAFLRAVDVPEDQFGASLSLMEGFTHARPLKGKDSGWQAVSLWFKTTADQRTARVACRLGNFGQITSGEAWCTGVSLEPQLRPPLNADYVYGPIDEATTPVGLPASVAIGVLVLMALARYARLPRGLTKREWLTLDAILLAILGVKIACAPFFKYDVDIGSYSAWAIKLAAEGPARFYAPGYFADYPPGYMYVLWGVGLLRDALGIPWSGAGFLILLKLPAMLADLAVARILFARLRPYDQRHAWLAALAFALNPALVVDSAVWGQTDSILVLLVLFAFLAQGERLFELAWIYGALAILTKPQALLLVPLLALWPWGWWKSGRPLSALLAALATVFLIADPFRGDRSWKWLIDLYGGTAGYYAETSVNAMNLAALLFGMRANDSDLALGLTYQAWGFIVGFTFGLGFLIAYLRRRDRVLYVYLIAATALVSFVCLTRMHERYLYPFFAFAGLLGVTGTVGALYWFLSVLFLVNELVVYGYQKAATAGPDWVWRTVAVLQTLGMVAWLGLAFRTARGRDRPPGAAALEADDTAWQRALEAPSVREADAVATGRARARGGATEPTGDVRAPLRWTMAEGWVLVAITVLALALRLWHLGQPTELVFDEVYFVEQGRNYLTGKDFMDPHPPIAKLTIGLGISLIGDTPTGWRTMNAVVGTALVVLIYLLTRTLFLRRPAATIAALFVAMDGLCLVDSRIAVIDIHYVTWAVAAYLATTQLVRRRAYESVWLTLLIGVLIGLSVGAKLFIPFFSFLLVIGTIILAGWVHARRLGRSPFSYLWRPVSIVGWTAFVVYCLTYTPHFLWGWWHSPIDLVKYVAIEVPNYQNAVADATHPYSSKWWTWPLLLRPVWYFWKDPGPLPGTVVGIWGSGNPSVWWAALPALLFATWHAVREKSFPLAFVVVGWAIHLAPWIPIGRTLFLYHYLPSLLFGILALAWLLDRLWEGEGSVGERGLMGAAVLASLLPVAFATMPSWGPFLFLLILIGYEALVFSRRGDPVRVGRTAVGAYLVAVIAISWYFLPIWLGTPISKSAWQERMWMSGFELMNWINWI